MRVHEYESTGVLASSFFSCSKPETCPLRGNPEATIRLDRRRIESASQVSARRARTIIGD